MVIPMNHLKWPLHTILLLLINKTGQGKLNLYGMFENLVVIWNSKYDQISYLEIRICISFEI